MALLDPAIYVFLAGVQQNLGRIAPRIKRMSHGVIARSEATRQSILPRKERWIASLRSQ